MCLFIPSASEICFFLGIRPGLVYKWALVARSTHDRSAVCLKRGTSKLKLAKPNKQVKWGSLVHHKKNVVQPSALWETLT